jgi:hypothetical protein
MRVVATACTRADSKDVAVRAVATDAADAMRRIIRAACDRAPNQVLRDGPKRRLLSGETTGARSWRLQMPEGPGQPAGTARGGLRAVRRFLDERGCGRSIGTGGAGDRVSAAELLSGAAHGQRVRNARPRRESEHPPLECPVEREFTVEKHLPRELGRLGSIEDGRQDVGCQVI